jgi:hypothetical protein
VEKDEDEQALPDALSALSLSASSTITPLGRLLEACGQDTPLDFSDLLANRTFFPPSVKTRPTTRKIGEATYSEVFAVDAGKSGQVVMKIIPLLSDEEALRTGKTVEERSENGESESESAPTLSDPRDVAREVELGRIVGSLDGFCTLHGYVESLSGHGVTAGCLIHFSPPLQRTRRQGCLSQGAPLQLGCLCCRESDQDGERPALSVHAPVLHLLSLR